jgi:hypothetical protein
MAETGRCSEPRKERGRRHDGRPLIYRNPLLSLKTRPAISILSVADVWIKDSGDRVSTLFAGVFRNIFRNTFVALFRLSARRTDPGLVIPGTLENSSVHVSSRPGSIW